MDELNKRSSRRSRQDKIERFLVDPQRAGLFLDFDGTLSHIVDVPSDARPAEGVLEALERLTAALKVVAIVSGRSATQLVEWLGADIEIWGVHGVERSGSSGIELAERVAPHMELMRKVKAETQERIDALGLDGVLLEDKGVMVALHYRSAANVKEAEAALSAIVDDLAGRHGLKRVGGRLAFELRPDVDFSKALVVLERARTANLAGVAFVGDDVVDIPGFEALDELELEGMAALRVAVGSDEAPAELLERADVVLDGPSDVVKFLQKVATHAEEA